MRDGKRNARLREELILAGLKGGTGCVSRAVCRFGTDADAACIALAFAAVVSAVLYIANDSANKLRAVALTICFLLLFVQFVFLFSADFLSARLFCPSKSILYEGEKIMSLYTIADLHLSTLDKTDKSMEVFGERWQSYTSRLENNWRHLVTEDDTVVIPGDISWALSLEEAVSDLKFIDSLPGKKILGKGNHDFWWTSMKKHSELFSREGISTISFLYNNALVAEDFIVAGTRGWYHDDDCRNMPESADFDKLTRREALRLRTSLNEAVRLRGDTEREIVVFMHFPPFWNGKESESLMDILEKYSIRRVYFGHIHGNYTVPPVITNRGIQLSLISADYLGFVPKIVK